jgi:DNA invertase Pin-like site-specific DNA recombinase
VAGHPAGPPTSSTTDQDLSIQQAALKAAGCEVIRAQKRSGTTTEGREALQTVLDFLHAGDVLMVTRIDRLARSIGDLQDIVRTVRVRGASLKATEQPIDTSTAAGKCFLDMLGVFAEFETNLRRERQLEGIAKAKAAGVYKGRPPSIEASRVRELKAQGMPAGRHRQGAQDRPGVSLSCAGHRAKDSSPGVRYFARPRWGRAPRSCRTFRTGPLGGGERRGAPIGRARRIREIYLH